MQHPPTPTSGLLSVRAFLLVAALHISCFVSQAQTDTTVFNLNEASISVHKNTSPITGTIQSEIKFSDSSIKSYPRSFGEADALSFLQSLPGVAGSGDFAPGLCVMGCENSQNLFRLAGAPVYYSPRMLGLFPSFNLTHFSQNAFKVIADGPNMGASLDFEPADTLASRSTGSANIGLLSANLSLTMPLSDRITATVSARKAFLNYFYKGAISLYGSPVLYDFWDANANVLYQVGPQDKIDANFFVSQDVAYLENAANMFGTNARWGDEVGSLRWRHDGKWSQNHTLYVTSHWKKAQMTLGDLDAALPSDLLEFGYHSEISLAGIMDLGLSARHFDIQPQSPSISGTLTPNVKQDRMEASLLSADFSKILTFGRWTIAPCVSVNHYKELSDDLTYNHIDPQLSITADFFKAGKVTLQAGRKHQYLIETGMLSSGIPTLFWMTSGAIAPPQESGFATLSHSVDLFQGAYTLTSQLYFKHLLHQVEYTGFIFDYLVKEYNLPDQLVETEGNNYGATVMLSKNSGKVTGWVSYAFGRALRTGIIDGSEMTFPASFERIHEIDAVASWSIGSFDVCANLIVASGLPFTPVKQLYIINNNLLAEYYPYNSGRLAQLARLDMSVNYHFKSRERYEHGVNFSLHNALGLDNQYSYFLEITDDGHFRYSPYSIDVPVIPSLSYFCSF